MPAQPCLPGLPCSKANSLEIWRSQGNPRCSQAGKLLNIHWFSERVSLVGWKINHLVLFLVTVAVLEHYIMMGYKTRGHNRGTSPCSLHKTTGASFCGPWLLPAPLPPTCQGRVFIGGFLRQGTVEAIEAPWTELRQRPSLCFPSPFQPCRMGHLSRNLLLTSLFAVGAPKPAQFFPDSPQT